MGITWLFGRERQRGIISSRKDGRSEIQGPHANYDHRPAGTDAFRPLTISRCRITSSRNQHLQVDREEKMLPIRTKRYCCAYLKEQAGGGTVTLLGIRAAESPRRAARNEVQPAIIAFPAPSTNSTAIKSGISRVWEAKIKSCSRQFTAGRIPMYGISFGVITYPIAGYTTRIPTYRLYLLSDVVG